MALSKSERIDLLEDARESLQQAIECLRQAFPGDRYVEAYMIEQLEIRAGSDRFLSGDLSIDKLIERVENGDDD